MRLVLKSEPLTELTAGELAAVAGGAPPTLKACMTGVYPTLPVEGCLDKLVVPPTEG